MSSRGTCSVPQSEASTPVGISKTGLDANISNAASSSKPSNLKPTGHPPLYASQPARRQLRYLHIQELPARANELIDIPCTRPHLEASVA